MALQPINPKRDPYGQFDGLDSQATSVLGGEVVTITYVALDSGDQAASDADGSDGYAGHPVHTRMAITSTLASGNRPLFLVDDGISGYGTLFGQVVGGAVGRNVAGAVLGPHTATGSGKLTCWDEAGFYSVTLDAVDTTVATGLVLDNSTLAGGDALYATTAGLLTPNVGAAFESVVLGHFAEFSTSGSLVNTPNNLTAALNSPPGGAAVLSNLDRALVYWQPEL